MASNPSDLEAIAEEILSATKAVSQFLKSGGHPSPSFAVDAPRGFPDAPEDIQAARTRLRILTRQLNDLVTSPSEQVWALPQNDMDASSLRYIYHFKIPQAVPLDGDISFVDLASKTRLDEPRLRRLLRYAMTSGLFSEPRIGYVAHTALSAVLATDRKAQAYIGHDIEISYPLNVKFVEAVEKWGDDGDPAHTAANIAHNTELPFYMFMMTHPDRSVTERFQGLMEGLSSSEGYRLKYTVEGYDWAALRNATVVDVGGGAGQTAIAIAEKYPDLRVIVQDLPHVAEIGKKTLPPGLSPRVELTAHDFFTPQPVKNADVYILRLILHNYPDKLSVKILQNLVPALKSGAKILVIDGVMPPPKTLPQPVEKEMRFMDMLMMTHFNGSEREIDDWKAIIAKADPRLKIGSVTKPVGSTNSVIEIVFEQ